MADSEKRRALIEAVLPDVPFDGWSSSAIDAAARRAGLAPSEVAALFPGGVRDVVAGFSHWADDRMLAALDEKTLAAMKVRDRVGTAVRARLALLEPHREAVRRALSVLALPQNMPLGMKLLYDTVNAIWYAAGDTASDFNFYTKRGLLAGVYAATMLYWLDDRSPASADTAAFFERRLAEVMQLPKLGAKLRAGMDWLPNPFRLMRVVRRH
jgi:ubiquinone biosynthesis protein COQ9